MTGVARSEEHISLNFSAGAAASGRQLPVAAIAGFSTWQPAMLGRTAGLARSGR